MCSSNLKPLFDIKPPGFDGWIRLYQECDSSGFWIKQKEINTIIGYCKGSVCCSVDESYIIKSHDESGKTMNFVSLPFIQSYIFDLPTVGKKRENAKNLNAFFNELKQKLFCINGIDAVKSEYETRDPIKLKDSVSVLKEIIDIQKERIELLENNIDTLLKAINDANTCTIEAIKALRW